MLVVAALRFVDPHPAYRPLTGAVQDQPVASGPSEADRCALEHALRLAADLGGRCLAITAGPAAADQMLRDALAAGADGVLRVEAPWLDPLTDDGSGTAAALAAALPARPALVLCGDHSADRGTGATPAFLAARLGAAQALGLLELSAAPPAGAGDTASAAAVPYAADGDGAGGTAGVPRPADGPGGTVAGARPRPGHPAELFAVRRLDGGRRERLAVPLPAVCSVEPAGVRLRRATLARVLAAASARVPVVAAPPAPPRLRVGVPVAYRPRPKPLAPPAGADPRQRALALTGALAERTPARVVTPPGPAEAADELLAYLRPLLPDLPWAELDAAGRQPEAGEGMTG